MPLSPNVVVVGSLNIDYIAQVEQLPAAGETVSATGLIQRFGGKGANQAIAAARQGARVSMIGCVGNDGHGRAYLARLRDEGIHAAVSITRHALTGTALIAVDSAGENLIIVAPGANGELQPDAVRAAARLLRATRLLLVQFEVPMPAVIEAVGLANRAGVPVVLNPSPWRQGFPWGKLRVDSLIANALEARAILGIEFRGGKGSRIRPIQESLTKKNIRRLIITRGAKPTICIGQNEYFEIPALRVRPVDTVGAGDAFTGTYAAALAEGLNVQAAIRRANCAGALATLKPGAQESIPTRVATELAVKRLV